MGKYLWKTVNSDAGIIKRLIGGYGLPRPFALYLASHRVDTESVDSYLNGPLKDLSDPFLLPGVEKASKRIWDAILHKESILIHGDYDTDGITSSALLHWVLTKNGANVSVFLPDRFDDGYGFTPDSLEKALRNGDYKLVVTVDCGITSSETVNAAKKKNIDVIITDHHEPKEKIPDAFALVNPKLHQDLKDFHIFAGVGVAFKLCHGFIKYGKMHQLGCDRFDLREGLDLVALGTIADIVPLEKENRILVKNGLKILSKQMRPGIRALCETAGLSSEIKSTDVTYSLAPRINAAGRFGDPITAFNLLTTDNIVEAYRFADALNNHNRVRQNREEQIIKEAMKQIESDVNYKINNRFSILVAGELWHQGIIGIVASRLSKMYNRPAIIFSINGREVLGSGRSIPGLNLIDALNECAVYLNRFGGHPMAAGLSMDYSNFGPFCEQFEDSVKKRLNCKIPLPHIDIDGEVEMRELNDDFFSVVDKLEPFGLSNSQPVFQINNLQPVKMSPMSTSHSRGLLKDDRDNLMQFVAFHRTVDTLPGVPRWNVIASPQISRYNNNEYRQLHILDIGTN